MHSLFVYKIGGIVMSVAVSIAAVGYIALKENPTTEVQCDGEKCFIVHKPRILRNDQPDEELVIEKHIRRGVDAPIETIQELNNKAGW